MSDIESELELDGYESFYNAIDDEVTQEYPCSECGSEMRYIGMKKEGSYRAISHCENCGNELEF